MESATIPRNRSRSRMWRRRSNVESLCSISWLPRPNFKKGCTVHNLGETRSSQRSNHLLLTPDTFVRAPLPGMKRCSAVVHGGRPFSGVCCRVWRFNSEAGGNGVPVFGRGFLSFLGAAWVWKGEGGGKAL